MDVKISKSQGLLALYDSSSPPCSSASSEESITSSLLSASSSSDGIAGRRCSNKSRVPSRCKSLHTHVDTRHHTDKKRCKRTHISKYAIEPVSSPINLSSSVMPRRISSRKTDAPDGVNSSLGSGRVVVSVGGSSAAQGALGVGECKKTCRSIPAVAMTGSTG